jgi:hypothetical protein
MCTIWNASKLSDSFSADKHSESFHNNVSNVSLAKVYIVLLLYSIPLFISEESHV